MTDDPTILGLAALMLVAAAGIAAFWVTWLRTEHDEPWQPPGWVQHERAFVAADSVLAVVLVAGAALLVLDEPLGRSLGLIAAGMLTFLGVLDAAYFRITGLFARDRGGVGNAAIVVSVLLLAVLLVLRLA